MRTQFTRELVALTNDLTLMCTLARDAAERVTDALVDADLTATYEVFALDEQLQKMYSACEARTVVLLALQAPVARDLRHVVTAIQIAGELSRITTSISRAADQVYKSHPEPVAPQPIMELLVAMGRLTAHYTAIAGQAVATGHQPVEQQDSSAISMQQLHQQLHSALAAPSWTHPTDQSIDIALVGNNLERCVDHTGRIDQLIRFLDTGIPPTAQSSDAE
ncbi:phosphate signaling complex PhoU family protein [Nocardia australiensis]|uniref:phosphate signaling complex PhoU family protein n=1 Tax=Nocardia australiensis TaxID=2887191 RepID=UPI001D1346B1|nr:PhoU domain-containing protein [Nocardia australiensis]